ncbi:MAG: hypothetical protein QOC81_194 [Thermoanaerobaculia bacterium]|jgi:hypothetical protein|nr:hypothetical protein [Thermoanaerobaculia bacterium]
MFHSRRAIFALTFILGAALHGQTKCPPLPEGATCDHYHYHVSVWNIDSHVFEDIRVTRPFVSAAACDKARVEAVRENALLADFVKTAKIDTSMLPNRFGDCHCDRTQEASSATFVDAKARVTQLRVQQDVAWSLRERLLGQSVTGVAERLSSLFGNAPAIDHFFRETMPPRLPGATSVRVPATLLETTIASRSSKSVVAAGFSLVPVPAFGAPLVVAPQAPAAPVQPVPPPVAPPLNVPAPVTQPSEAH